jgi:hypothetical protein
MFRFICATLTIAVLTAVLAIGCGSDSGGKAAAGAGGTTTTSTIITPKGGTTSSATGAGGSTAPTTNTTTTTTTTTTQTVAAAKCGDGKVNQTTEQCDGADMGVGKCVDLGYGEGTLGCTADCQYDPTTCPPVEEDAGDYGG